MKIAILFGSPKISGGSYVIFQHAAHLMARGHAVDLVTLNPIAPTPEEMWHDAMPIINFVHIVEAKKKQYDIAIATWWQSPFHLPKLNAKQYAYFVQSIEAYFSEDWDVASQYLAHASYGLGLPVITEAVWIKDDLESRFNSDVFFVENGIRKDIYCLEGPALEPKPAKGLRILIEGAVTSRFKNIARTVDAARASGSHEIWLLTPSSIDSYPLVDRTISNIPIHQVPLIYRSCDVLVKQSTVEGMFGPPLEMFHCGGTAVVSNVTGYDQYIVNEHNALVTSIGNSYQVTEAINRLAADPSLLQRLKDGATATAKLWPEWGSQSALFEEAIVEICNLPRVSREKLSVDVQQCLNLHGLIKQSIGRHYQRSDANNAISIDPNVGIGERMYLEDIARPLALPTRITTRPLIARRVWHPATQKTRPAAIQGVSRKVTPRVFGVTISNEHIEELWHPIVVRAGWEARYMCSRPKGHFLLFGLTRPEVPNTSYLVADWIANPQVLFGEIEKYRPDLILFHNGNHPAYQHVLSELKARFNVPIAYSELGWFPQREHVYFDPSGTNGASRLHKLSLEELAGREFREEKEERALVSNKVILALQLENDTNSLIFSPHFSSNRDLIEAVVAQIPKNYEILVKPHPLDHAAHRYDRFLDHRSRIVSDPMSDLLSTAGAVIAVNSTVLLEAMDYPINIYSCGLSILSNKGIAFEFDNSANSLASEWREKYIVQTARRAEFVKYLKSYQLNLRAIDQIDDDRFFSNPSVKILDELLNSTCDSSAGHDSVVRGSQQPTASPKRGQRLLVRSTVELMAAMVEYDVISFDVFDTLLVREIYAPEDIFSLVGRDAVRLVGDSKFDHKTARLEAEKAARRACPAGEVTLAQIYMHYLLQTGLPADVINAIKEREVVAELKFLRRRESGARLYNFARGTGRPIIILSDSYMSEAFIRQALQDAGYDLDGVRIYLSSSENKTKAHGALFDLAASDLLVEPGRILHIGDNFQTDTTKGMERGFNVAHVPSPKVSLDVSPILKSYLNGSKGNLVGSRTLEWAILLGIINNGVFDDHFSANLKSAFGADYKRFGYVALGPLLTSFIDWVRDKAAEMKVDVIIFLARDGWVMERANALYDQHAPATERKRSAYVAASRRLLDILAINHSFENITRIVNSRYSRGALAEFLKVRLDLDPADVSERALATAGYSSLNDAVALPQDRVRLMKLLQALKDQIAEKASSLEAAYRDHLRDKGVAPGDKVAVVDIGYFGTMQKTIDDLLEVDGCEVYGFYLALRSEAHLDAQLRGKIFGYLCNNFDPADGQAPMFARKFALLEQFFSAPHASVLGVKRADGKIAIETMSATGEEAQWDNLECIHSGALQFVERAAALEARWGRKLNLSAFNHASHLDALFLSHNAELSGLMSSFAFENRYNGEGVSLLSKTLLRPTNSADSGGGKSPIAKGPEPKAAPKPAPPKAPVKVPDRGGPSVKVNTELKNGKESLGIHLPNNLIPALKLAERAVRKSDSVIEIGVGSAGHVVYGPYLDVSAGSYRVTVEFECASERFSLFKKSTDVVVDVVADGGCRSLAIRRLSKKEIGTRGVFAIEFSIDRDKPAKDLEMRVWVDGNDKFLLKEARLDRCTQ